MARLGVLIFAIAVLGIGISIGSRMLDDSTPLLAPLTSQLSQLGQLSGPTEAVAPDDTTKHLFVVRPGATAVNIGEELQQRGLIRSALGFRFVVEEQNVGNKLAAGEYELSRSMTTQEIVTVLARGQVKRGILATIPEGWRSEQIADKLDALGFASRDEFLAAVANPRSVPGVELLGEPPPPTLEGYLFPETYEVRERVSGIRAAELMVRMFAQRSGEQLRRAAPHHKLSAHELLTVASVVEREAQKAAERPTIASVYLNRLDIGMPLQADPTVQYAVANADLRAAASYAYWKQDLTNADLQRDSPFNTYTRPGLPPSPICNPGLASVEAVLRPASTDYLYFVARDDGTHLFGRTLDEHNENVARVSR